MRAFDNLCVLALLAVAVSACSTHSPDWDVTVLDAQTGIGARLIGLDAADADVVWVAGTGGTYGRSTDSGATWSFGEVPGADSLQFRDLHAVDSVTAYLLSIGPGDQSRIYRTDSGGESWDLQWENPDPEGFFDCFDFWSPTAGIAMGDAVDGRIMISVTSNGRDWRLLDRADVPPGVDGEGGFAASGTCLVASGDSTVWIGTGSSEGSRVYRSRDRGRSWSVFRVPLVVAPQAAGIMTLSFVTESEGYAAGGALEHPDDPADTFAATLDGGASWELRGRPQLPNVYGLAAQRIGDSTTLLAVGPKGMDVSFDSGWSWRSVDKRNYWSVQFIDSGVAITVGPAGRISRVTISRSPAS